VSRYEYIPQHDPSLEDIRSGTKIEKNPASLKLLFSLVDLTTLNTDDTASKVMRMCGKLNEFHDHFPEYPHVGAICVYPLLVPVIKENLRANEVNIASVSAGFPASQTFPEIKEMESKKAVEAGANEIDIVISVGKFLEKDPDYVSAEIRLIRKAIGSAKLKVILETGLLPDPGSVYLASMISMESGADFIKTSTGKVQPAATPEAVLVMCHAIRNYHKQTGRKVGIKPAGGISTAEDALEYASIVEGILGEEWLNPGIFRIGASRLANHLLSDISTLETGKPRTISYF
jgi:deoxyribose-phosphate aldolase